MNRTVKDSVSISICCYVRYLLKYALKSEVKQEIFVLFNISTVGIEITKTYDDMIGLRQLVCIHV